MAMLRIAAAGLIGFAFVSAPATAGRSDCPTSATTSLSGCVDIETVMAGDLQLSGARIDAMEWGQTSASVHLKILNRGRAADRLLGASSVAAARVELSGDRGDDGVAIKPGDSVEFAPGALRFVMSNVDGYLRPGGEVEVTLDFEKAGSVVVSFPVRASASTASAAH
ncbi:copper chaperone PCu(A)C [Aliihoeflea sp. PC F10.4]